MGREKGVFLERWTSGEVRLLTGRSPELLGRSGNLPGKLWIARKSTGREVARKSPVNFRRSEGDILGKSDSLLATHQSRLQLRALQTEVLHALVKTLSQ